RERMLATPWLPALARASAASSLAFERDGVVGALLEGLGHAPTGAAGALDAAPRDLRAGGGAGSRARGAILIQTVGGIDRDVAVAEVLEVDVGVGRVREFQLVPELIREAQGQA